ncbi:hypothetical protein MNV49_003603 [Pseudohyphozyma bogoriensis]|nr:hypothetical protein MNV49_003603 [Pseudohyphozyma bogoriensis]
MVFSSDEEKIRIVIVGAGISGIGQAIRLTERLGSKAEITVYERDADAGGVWYRALWPGAGVDVPIHWYSLYSDPKSDWPTRFAKRDDVWKYWQGLIDKYQLRNNFNFNTTFLGSRWSETSQTHTVRLQTDGGKPFEVVADFLISAAGPLSTPIIPKVEGLEIFTGNSFHNLRWDPKVELEGKRVAVVGNGSSGIQMVPGLAKLPGVTLVHFIRSGGYFQEKVDTPYSNLVQWGFRWIPGLRLLHRVHIFLQWQKPNFTQQSSSIRRREKVEADHLEYLKRKAPQEYLGALWPTFPVGCKRTACDEGWLESLHRPNVTLVSSNIIGADANGLITADGVHHDLDVIIFATGASVPQQGLGLNKGVFGRDGKELSEIWKEKGGPEAYKGVAVPGVPNYFITMGPNGTSGAWGFSSAIQTSAIARIIGEVFENGGKVVEVTQEAADAWNLGLWWAVRKTTWSHWTVKRRSSKGELKTINVGRRILFRRAAKLVALVLVGTLAAYRLEPRYASLLQQHLRGVKAVLWR